MDTGETDADQFQETVPPTAMRPGYAPGPGPSNNPGGATLSAMQQSSRKRGLSDVQPQPEPFGRQTPIAGGLPGRDTQEDQDEQGAAHESFHTISRPTVRRRVNEGAHTVQARRTANTSGPPRRTIGGPTCCPAGHLYRIQLINFMCHENFEVTFNDHLTFIGGHNGSGKSAVLQGIQACLGVSARDTGRGSKIGEWVRHGQHQATATLEIWNSTEEECPEGNHWPPFRHEIYGSMIRVVRKFSTSSSTYHFYRADQRPVSPAALGHTPAKELEALRSHFNMDAANPLVVITQDKVKNFHDVPRSAAAGCAKYRMYMEGTCLAAVRDTLAATSQKLAVAEANVAARKEQLQAKERELRSLEKRQQQLEHADEMKQLVADLEVAMLWTAVSDLQEALRSAKEGAAASPARVAEAQQQVEQCRQEVDDLQAEEQKLREAMEQTRIDPRSRMEELKSQKSQAAKRLKLVANQRRTLEAQAQDLAMARDDLEVHLAEQQGEEPLRRMREHGLKVEAANRELAGIQAQITEAEAQRAELNDRRRAAATARAEQQSARDAAREALQEAEAALRALSAGDNGGASDAVLTRAWGRGPMDLLAAVRAARPGTFSAPPIGPLGMYLRRVPGADARMNYALEGALGNVLDWWLVNTWQDQEKLRSMAASLNVRAPVVRRLTFTARHHDYGLQPVVDGQGQVWRRVIDMVEPVDGLEPRVRCTLINALVDHAAAARVALVASRQAGHAVARAEVPGLKQRGVTKAFDTDGYSYELRGLTMVTSSNRLPSFLRLFTDNRAQLEEAQREVQARAADLQAADVGLQEAAAQVDELERSRGALEDQQLRQLTRRKRECESRLAVLQQEAPASTEAATASIMNQIRHTESQQQQVAARVAELESEANNINDEVEQVNKSMEALSQQMSQYARRREELVEELRRCATRKKTAEGQLAEAREKLQAVQAEMQANQQRIDSRERELEQATAIASEVCSREEGREVLQQLHWKKECELADKAANRTEAQRAMMLREAMTSKGLHHWCTTTRAAVQRAEREAGGDLEAIRLQADAARRSVTALKAAVEAVSKKVTTMKEAQDIRRSKYHGLRKQVDRFSNIKFNQYMSRRSFAAAVRVDHEEETLELTVRKANEQQEASSMLELSGGERSFTTTSFLLAMGEVLDTPFRAMDEYDVYLDTDRRKMATLALLDYAWRVSPHSQLILLSPQDTSIITEAFRELVSNCRKQGVEPPPNNFMKVIRMADPRQQQQP